jgi:hypothetical protein
METPVKGRRGRQKGQVKEVTVIKDPIFGPYEIHQDQNCFSLIEIKPGSVDNTIGYFHELHSAIERLAKCKMVDKSQILTLRGYIDEYKKEVNQLKKAIKI